MILIEGQIGAGKTTLCNIFHQRLNIPVHYELGDEDASHILNDFYADKKRWSYLSQTHFLINRFKTFIERRGDAIFLVDRSIYGDKIFAELLYEEGIMTAEEYRTYKKLHDIITASFAKPMLLIYLDCSVDDALWRIAQRSRECEKNISRNYLEKLNRKYKEWFDKYNDSPKIYIDSNELNICEPEGSNTIISLAQKQIEENLVVPLAHIC